MDLPTVVRDLARTSSTPLLDHILDDLRKLRQWAHGYGDMAAVAFFDTAIDVVAAELQARRDVP